MADLWQLGVQDLAEGIKQRSFSDQEVLDSLAMRIGQVEPVINAWATLDLDRARDETSAASSRSAPDPRLTPLCGVPIGIKDVFLTRGMQTCMGSRLFDGYVPSTDAAAVARLRLAGAVLPGKTVTCAFAGPDPAKTCNPWRHDRTPGGSSAGSAAAVACAMVPGALGTQTAGSVLRPSAYCGIVGFKPTYQTISCDGVFPFARSLDTVGLMARSVADVRIIFQAFSASAGLLSAAVAPIDASRSGQPALRVGILDCGKLISSADAREHTADVARQLESHGAQVSEVRLPLDLDLLLAAQGVITHAEAASVHFQEIKANRELYEPGMRAVAELGTLIPAPAYEMALRLQKNLSSAVDQWLRPGALLMLPTFGEPVPDTTTTGNPALQAIFTFLGMPAVALPTGFSADGMPQSTQIAAKRGDDWHLLAAAEWMQLVLGYPVKFPHL
jgi:aspartyl-tRNA(Asn)/glutamyl-tRNA(Gln) amidotransferase subunit A